MGNSHTTKWNSTRSTPLGAHRSFNDLHLYKWTSLNAEEIITSINENEILTGTTIHRFTK